MVVRVCHDAGSNHYHFKVHIYVVTRNLICILINIKYVLLMSRVFMLVRLYTYSRCVYVCMYVYIYIYICICVCVYIYIYIYVCVCICMCVCICVCVYIYIYIYSMLKTKVTDKPRVG